MKREISPKIVSLVFAILVFCFVVVFYAVGWTEPTQAPPAGNVPAPLNTGSIGQEKIGGLILNTGGAAVGLIIDQGDVGIGTTSPAQKLDVSGQIHASGDICTDQGGGVCLSGGPYQTIPTWRIKMGDKGGVAEGYTLPSQFTNPKYTWYEPEGLFFHSENGNSLIEFARSSLMEIKVRSVGAQSKRIYFRYVWAHLFFYLNGALVYESNNDHAFVNGSDPYYTFNLVDGINTIQIVYHRHDGNNRVWVAGNVVDNVNTFFVPF